MGYVWVVLCVMGTTAGYLHIHVTPVHRGWGVTLLCAPCNPCLCSSMQDMILVIAVVLILVGIVGFFLTRGRAPAAPTPVAPPATSVSSAYGGAGKAGAGAKAAEEHEVDHSLCPITVFYGSQTGSAEGFSKQIVNEAKKHGFRPKLVDLESFVPATSFAPLSPNFPPLVVFVMATYGEGDPTDNASEFVKWLKDAVRGGKRVCGWGWRRQCTRFCK